ncbi:MAG: biopolymer transporter ExbD [Elusimicrobia bacterium]|nr:biopolymer transporter ExbD [Elusimicrobiota bacterium]
MARYALARLGAQTPRPEPVTEVSVVPVIDISLVLLVILFVTAPLLSDPGLPVALPAARRAADPGDALAVTCTADGRLSVLAAPSSWPALAADLQRELARRPGAEVLLRADADAPYRLVSRLLAAAKAAGAERIALATAPVK